MPAGPYCCQLCKPHHTKETIIETLHRYSSVHTALLATLPFFLKNKNHKHHLGSHLAYGFDILHSIALN